ncbi:MAG: diacylglycerol kinase family protein [Anaeromassilibacillus sp.]
MRFVKSLKYALRGIVYCINNERNMRIHTVAVLYVLAFSPFFEMSRARYAILLVTFALVLMAETFNTVAEELCDLVAPSFHPVVRIVKDMAAGGVLICAGFAVGVGVCLFWQPAAFLRIWRYFLDNPAMIAVLLASIALALVYILAGPSAFGTFSERKAPADALNAAERKQKRMN